MATKKKTTPKKHKNLKSLVAAAGDLKLEIDSFGGDVSFFAKTGATKKEIEEGADDSVNVLTLTTDEYITQSLKLLGVKAKIVD